MLVPVPAWLSFLRSRPLSHPAPHTPILASTLHVTLPRLLENDVLGFVLRRSVGGEGSAFGNGRIVDVNDLERDRKALYTAVAVDMY